MPKGRLLIIGGAEDKGGTDDSRPAIKGRNKNFRHYEILGELLPKEDREHRIEIVTTASEQPQEMSDAYIDAFHRIGFTNIHHINIQSRDQARESEFVDRVNRAHAVMFTGGDQFRLSTILGGTEFIEAVRRKYFEDKDFIVAGTSAGAMVMSKIMIYGGQSHEALLAGDLKLTSGFGFLDRCIIDTHFIKRGRFGRLAQAIIMNPQCIGIGLGEDTALIIKKGNIAECRGSGMVIIIDGQDMGHSNIAYAEPDTPLCVENLRVHILARTDGYSIKDRQFIVSPEDINYEDGIR